MITLGNGVVKIEVLPDNPIYKALSVFSGESFTVQLQNTKTEPTPTPQKEAPKKSVLPETVGVEVDVQEYFDRLDRLYLDDKDIVKSIFRNHAILFFGGANTKTRTYAAVKDQVFDKHVTCVRIIDNEIMYITVPKTLVRDI
jgi:hypothetical protein